MRLPALLCALLLCDCIVAGAQSTTSTLKRPPAPWVVIGTSPAALFSLDTSRAVQDSVDLSVWLRFDYAQDQTTPPIPRGPYRRAVLREGLRCATKEALDLKMVLYDVNGAQLEDFDWPTPTWRAFSEHPMRPYFEMVCAGVRRPG